MVMNIVFIGMLDDPMLIASIGLGILTENLVVVSVDYGLCTGLDTLVSQAFGRKNYTQCRAFLNTSRIVVTFFFVIQVLILLNCEKVFALLGQPPEIYENAKLYILYSLPSMYMMMQFECTRHALLAQSDLNAVMYISALSF